MYLLAEYWSWWVGYFSSIVVPVLAWQSSTARPTGKVAPPLHYPGLGSINPGYVSGLGPGLTLDWDTAHCTTLHYTRYNNIIQQCYYNNNHYYTALYSFASTHILVSWFYIAGLSLNQQQLMKMLVEVYQWQVRRMDLCLELEVGGVQNDFSQFSGGKFDPQPNWSKTY